MESERQATEEREVEAIAAQLEAGVEQKLPPSNAVHLDALPLETRIETLAKLDSSERRAAAWTTLEPEERASTLGIMTAEGRREALNQMTSEDREATMLVQGYVAQFVSHSPVS